METMAKDEGSPSPVVTRELRADVVDRVRQPGNTVHSVARELELIETAVREWVKQWQIVSWMTSRPAPDAATVARIRCLEVPAAKERCLAKPAAGGWDGVLARLLGRSSEGHARAV